MPVIDQLHAIEILDSRGRPTLQVTCRLESGASAVAQVPSGASTGQWEAHELRDGDARRHGGLGCRKAVSNVNVELADNLTGKEVDSQATLDNAMIELDGTTNKSRLGANAILGVSLSFARAHATQLDLPLYRHFANLLESKSQRLPMLTINLFSGGKHAGGQVSIQDILIVPKSANSIAEGLAMCCDVYRAAAELIQSNYGMRQLTADEGGLAPPFTTVESMFEDAVTAIERAGYAPGEEVSLAVDIASSHFYRDGRYELDSQSLDSDSMIDRLLDWTGRYPIISVEDGLAEDDWEFWPRLLARAQARTLVLGDDLLCTNPSRIQRAVKLKACNALLLKVNQVGTLTEAAEAVRLARQADWHVTISARSGETEDDWLADLAVGWGGDHIKVGSVRQSERLAKYNRLLSIEAETGL